MFETWIALAVTALVMLCAAWGLTYRMRKFGSPLGRNRTTRCGPHHGREPHETPVSTITRAGWGTGS
ncbi:hypothetical protein FHX42_001931 [Saccharopolyspora lacisalsi]|uniref:Uncharacterized protein n=1 Tax=Halosaccharopolyspora lacisalsi TaxID=1000566 RepID=A0A839DSU8_9PSEU|nr:hypothetical protein [Halosaccharopolyspora lacisalsi]MBA8824584.1 hypothetical protein [Halosaccharopolyspora lacisalsi]